MTARLHLLFVLFCCTSWLWMALSCSRSRPVMEHTYRSLPTEGWSTYEPMNFFMDTLREDGWYNLRIGIRLTEDFPYRSVWLQVSQTWNDSMPVRLDTVVCRLTDSDGDFSGSGLSVYQYEFPIGHFFLKKGAAGRIMVRHLMRREMLPGVSDIGILLDEEIK